MQAGKVILAFPPKSLQPPPPVRGADHHPMPKLKHPFAQRIMIAFVLMTALVSGAFSFGIVAVVHFVEQHLVSEEMHRELNSVLHEDLKLGHPPRLDAQTYFFASHLPEYPVPERFKALPEGFSEIEDGDHAFYVYVQEINNRRYLLVQEQDEFEAREQALFHIILAGFVFSVLGAWMLGRIMAGKVMAPLTRLAGQVRHRDQLLPLAPPLAPEYPDDEVGQLAAAFDSTIGQLRQSLERERFFTSDVSHELRTPLMVVASSCELLQQGTLTPQQQAPLQRIERATREMSELVQTFLQLARGQNNKDAFSGSATLAQLADRQCALWQGMMQEKGLDFACVPEAQENRLYNAPLLSAVMSNLLRNAWHYTDRGQVRLFLENGAFRVEDSGCGIDEGQHDRIFQAFVRGPQARGEGLGLGLSLTRRICAHQGWQITANNRPSGGSCFRVILAGTNSPV